MAQSSEVSRDWAVAKSGKGKSATEDWGRGRIYQISRVSSECETGHTYDTCSKWNERNANRIWNFL